MLKKLEKVEEKLNTVIEKLICAFWWLVHKILPKRVFEIWHNFLKGCKKTWFSLFEWGRNTGVNFVLWLQEFRQRVVTKKDHFIAWNLKGKITGFLQGIKNFLLKTPLRSTVEFISRKMKPLGEKLNEKLNSGITSQLAIAGLALAMITGGLYGVYVSSTKIYEQEFPYREPASVQEYDEKPEYYYFKDTTTLVQNIKFPVQVVRASQVDSVTIDFSIRTSTRFAAFYLKENEHKLKDYFFTAVEPLVSDFALKEEGKDVMREKIQIEVQRFLDNEKVEGQVLEVNILYIVGS